jgi:hypothetical protein
LSHQSPKIVPVEGPEEILEFVLSRFAVDLQKGMRLAMDDDTIVVAITTHTEYYDPTLGGMVAAPPTTTTAAAASVPSISVGQDVAIVWNRILHRNQYQKIPKRFKNTNNVFVDGFERMMPVEFVDLEVGIRFFHSKPNHLVRFQRAFIQYLDIFPYLFIPDDLTNRNGITDVDELQALLEQWWAYPMQDLATPGIFVSQELPIDKRVFSTKLRANRSNLFAAESHIEIMGIPLPNQLSLGNRELFNAYRIPISNKEDATESELSVATEGTLEDP